MIGSKKAPISRIKESKYLRILKYVDGVKPNMCTIRVRKSLYHDEDSLYSRINFNNKGYSDLVGIVYGDYVYTSFLNYKTGKKECWRFKKDENHYNIDISVSGRKFCPSCGQATRIILKATGKKDHCPACAMVELSKKRTNAVYVINAE